MLRRAPTALTISPEDITAFEQSLQHKKLHRHFLKTGEDPHRLFQQHPQRQQSSSTAPGNTRRQQQQEEENSDDASAEAFDHARFHARMAANMSSFGGDHDHGEIGDRQQQQQQSGNGGGADPSDELKPLPGDKARIVRSREERIMGVGSGAAGRDGGNSSSNNNTRGNGGTGGERGIGV